MPQRYQEVREPSDLATEIPPVQDEFRQPDVYEFALHHVGCTQLHEQHDIDEYFAVRAKEDLQSYREWQGYAPYAEKSASVSNIMEDLYRKFTQHKWLPLQTAWPFNLRMVTFVLMHAKSSDATVVADKLVNRIRTWGCPVSPFGDDYSEWRERNSRDAIFNRFSVVASGRERHRLVKDLFQIRVAVQDDKWLPRRPRWWNRRKPGSERSPLGAVGASLDEADPLMRLESFDNPSEYVPYHVGRTHLHRHLDTDQYFAVRVEEDRWAFLQQFNRWPPNVLEASRIMVHLYRTFTQHKWLPLQTAWPFNLRMVAFVLMHTDSAEAIVADMLVQRIRSWGCPVSPFADGHDTWARSNNRDVDVQPVPRSHRSFEPTAPRQAVADVPVGDLANDTGPGPDSSNDPSGQVSTCPNGLRLRVRDRRAYGSRVRADSRRLDCWREEGTDD